MTPRIEPGAGGAVLHVLRDVKRATMRWAFGPQHPYNAYHLRRAIVEACGCCVASGPFAGMAYVDTSVGSSFLPKLLGTYEQELHGVIESALGGAYDCVLNIGCGEGYYAVGMARGMRADSAVAVHAYDVDPRACELTCELAQMNGVAHRVSVGSVCDAHELERHADSRALVICDIEGAERELLDPTRTPMLARCDMLVEVHDGLHSDSIERMLTGRFGETHRIVPFRFEPRRVEDFPPLPLEIDASWRLYAMDEGRTYGILWLFMEARWPVCGRLA